MAPRAGRARARARPLAAASTACRSSRDERLPKGLDERVERAPAAAGRARGSRRSPGRSRDRGPRAGGSRRTACFPILAAGPRPRQPPIRRDETALAHRTARTDRRAAGNGLTLRPPRAYLCSDESDSHRRSRDVEAQRGRPSWRSSWHTRPSCPVSRATSSPSTTRCAPCSPRSRGRSPGTCRTPPSGPDVVAARLDTLRGPLRAHFDEEERARLFETIEEHAPEQAPRPAPGSRSSTSALVRRLDALRAASPRGPPRADGWVGDVRRFLDDVASHEERETDLLQATLDGSTAADRLTRRLRAVAPRRRRATSARSGAPRSAAPRPRARRAS